MSDDEKPSPEDKQEEKDHADENPVDPNSQEQIPSGSQPKPNQSDDLSRENSKQKQPLRGQVEQFRPHRISVTEEQQPQEDDENLALLKGVPQSHKPEASAYTKLVDADSVIDVEGTSGLDLIASDSSGIPRTPSLEKKQPPARGQCWSKFKKYVYNNENNAYCNRSISNWCAICTYYFWIIIIFLAVFMLYILTFIWRDSENKSPALLKITIMPDPNPALAIVPLDTKNGDMLLWYKSTGPGNYRKPQDSINDITGFLAKQELTCHQQKLLQKPCPFERAEFGPCAYKDYGYDKNKPCIFLKLNNLFTWMPAPIPKNTEFGPEISKKLVKKILNETPSHNVYVDCRGETLYDQQYLGNIKYYPEQAFDVKHFPATKETKTNPLVAIKLNNIQAGHVIQIHCTLLAGNIKDKANSNIKLTVYIE